MVNFYRTHFQQVYLNTFINEMVCSDHSPESSIEDNSYLTLENKMIENLSNPHDKTEIETESTSNIGWEIKINKLNFIPDIILFHNNQILSLESANNKVILYKDFRRKSSFQISLSIKNYNEILKIPERLNFCLRAQVSCPKSHEWIDCSHLQNANNSVYKPISDSFKGNLETISFFLPRKLSDNKKLKKTRMIFEIIDDLKNHLIILHSHFEIIDKRQSTIELLEEVSHARKKFKSDSSTNTALSEGVIVQDNNETVLRNRLIQLVNKTEASIIHNCWEFTLNGLNFIPKISFFQKDKKLLLCSKCASVEYSNSKRHNPITFLIKNLNQISNSCKNYNFYLRTQVKNNDSDNWIDCPISQTKANSVYKPISESSENKLETISFVISNNTRKIGRFIFEIINDIGTPVVSLQSHSFKLKRSLKIELPKSAITEELQDKNQLILDNQFTRLITGMEASLIYKKWEAILNQLNFIPNIIFFQADRSLSLDSQEPSFVKYSGDGNHYPVMFLIKNLNQISNSYKNYNFYLGTQVKNNESNNWDNCPPSQTATNLIYKPISESSENKLEAISFVLSNDANFKEGRFIFGITDDADVPVILLNSGSFNLIKS